MALDGAPDTHAGTGPIERAPLERDQAQIAVLKIHTGRVSHAQYGSFTLHPSGRFDYGGRVLWREGRGVARGTTPSRLAPVTFTTNRVDMCLPTSSHPL